MKKKYRILNLFYFKFGKRFLDIIIGLFGTVFIFIPTLTVIAIFYQFGRNRGPIFFRQERVGLNGKLFQIIKFRSMVVNAEQVLKSDENLYKKYLKNSYKLSPEEDPRLTSIGAFIRKTSIDELPQFWNVLRGEMSFIGPRPIIIEELEEYDKNQRIRFLSVKPGATGWWQVSGRSDVFYPERCELELYYVENYSIGLDFKIFFLTIAKVLRRSGAR